MADKIESRDVQNFNEVILQLTGTVFLKQADRDSLVIQADEKLLHRIKTDIQGRKLVISWRSWTDWLFPNPEERIHYYIGMREIQGFTISGSGKLAAEDLQTPLLRLNVSGSGTVDVENLQTDLLSVMVSGACNCNLSGRARLEEIQVSGSANYQAADLECEDASLRVSGYGDMQVYVSSQMKVQISGAASVRYRGEPTIKQHITGSGLVERLFYV